MAMRKLQVLDDSYQNNPLMSGLSYLTTVGEARPKQESVLEIAKRGTTGAMRPDERAVPSVLTPGSIRPGTSAGGRVVNERGGGGAMAQPSVSYSPSMGSMAAPTARAEGVPQAATQKQIASQQPSAEVSAARGYTPELIPNMPEFVNYYGQLTSPFTEADRRRAEAAAISNVERQYTQAANRIRQQLASRGLMSGGGTGLEGALMAQAAMEAAGARERALTGISQDFMQKQADYNMRQAEGMMRAQDEQYKRFVDQQLLPMRVAESKEQVKQIMLQNGINQYAIDQYLKMDANEWPDWVKNLVKVGIMGAGIYTGQPGIVAAGAAYR